MNSPIRKHAVPFGALFLAIIFVIVALFLSLSNNVFAGNQNSTQNGRLVTIYDRGAKKTVLSRASTIGDAIRESGILIDSNDVVEPATTTTMVATNYQVNIYRARPVVIVDGNIRQKIMTAYQTAEQIATSAGITLYSEDFAELKLTDNLIDGAGFQLVVSRATPISFTLYGKTNTIRTQSKTVGDFIKEKGIIIAENDKISVGLDSAITNNMSLKIWREGKQTITVDESIDFEVETIDNADQPVGYRDIKTVGQKGERTVVYEITIQNDIEVGRKEINSVVTKQPSVQVEIVGVKGKYNTPSENETIIWNFLRAQGFSRIQTAGIMGNLQQEHQFNTTDVTGGLGIAQWTLDRRTDLINKYPDSYTNIYSQLAFLMEELNGTYYRARDAIMATDNLDTAVVAFQEKFEGCGVCKESQRKEYARTILGSHQ